MLDLIIDILKRTIYLSAFLYHSQKDKRKSKYPIKAYYDNGIYLANNKDTFVYENKTVHDIFIDIYRRFGIKYSDAAKTSYKIPKLTKSKTTAWDAISQDLISAVYLF